MILEKKLPKNEKYYYTKESIMYTVKYKILITPYQNKLLSILYEGEKAIEIAVEENLLQGSIHVAKVKNIVHNIESAFLEIEDKQLCYYSLADNQRHNYVDGREHSKLCEGDDIIIQITKEASKTKSPIASAHITLTGVYLIISRGRGNIRFSSKIKDKDWKEEISKALQDFIPDTMDILLRTNSYHNEKQIQEELESLSQKFTTLLKTAYYRTSPHILQNAEPKYHITLKKLPLDKLKEVITDIPSVYTYLQDYLISTKLRFYKEEMIQLEKLYSLTTLMDSVFQKKVWLKSGAYLVIEYTEAMTVIDVNTGKVQGKSKVSDTIRKVNIEAGIESARQIRLRNLSGIIMIDFINMQSKEDKKEVFEILQRELEKDSLKAKAIGYTNLGLMEVTRQKIMKPIYEYFKK